MLRDQSRIFLVRVYYKVTRSHPSLMDGRNCIAVELEVNDLAPPHLFAWAEIWMPHTITDMITTWIIKSFLMIRRHLLWGVLIRMNCTASGHIIVYDHCSVLSRSLNVQGLLCYRVLSCWAVTSARMLQRDQYKEERQIGQAPESTIELLCLYYTDTTISTVKSDKLHVIMPFFPMSMVDMCT